MINRFSRAVVEKQDDQKQEKNRKMEYMLFLYVHCILATMMTKEYDSENILATP